MKENLAYFYEHKMEVNLLFIDFKQAYDSVTRRNIYEEYEHANQDD